MNEIRKCFNYNVDTIFENFKGSGLRETEFCHYCDNVFCPDCMDFSEEENICKQCAIEKETEKPIVLVVYREDERIYCNDLGEAEMEQEYLERVDDCYTRIEEKK